jgi:hypothetical protein
MTSTKKTSSKSANKRARSAVDNATRVGKVEVKLDCDCGAMLVPVPFVENNHMRIAYNCPKHGQIHVVDPFADFD